MVSQTAVLLLSVFCFLCEGCFSRSCGAGFSVLLFYQFAMILSFWFCFAFCFTEVLNGPFPIRHPTWVLAM